MINLCNAWRHATIVAAAAAATLLAACAGVGGNKPDDSPQATTQANAEDPARYRARIHTELGANYFQRQQYPVALEELREAIRVDPKYGLAYSVLGMVHADLGETGKADAAFQQAISVAPSEGDIRNNYGSYLCRQNRSKEGLEQFDAALRQPLYQTPHLALENAGFCALASGQLKAAEGYFARLTQFAPMSSRGYQGLAAIAMKTSRFDEVRKQVRMAMSTQPITPDLLYFGVCAERQLGDRVAEDNYLQLLKSRFGESPFAARVQKGVCE